MEALPSYTSADWSKTEEPYWHTVLYCSSKLIATTEAISNPEKISKISDPFVILIERLHACMYIITLCKYPKVEIRMILMPLIF